MLKSIVRGCTFVVLLGFVGCGGSEREGLINETLAQLNRATTLLGNIRDSMQKAIKTAEGEKRNVAPADFDKLVKDILPDLKDVGDKMQILKRQIEAQRDTVTEEQRKALAERFAKQTDSALTSLRDEQLALNKVMQEAQRLNDEAIKEVKKKLAEAQAEFEVIAKLR